MKCQQCGATLPSTHWSAFTAIWFYEKLREYNWNRTHTANAVGISVRTVRHWVKHLRDAGYDIPDSVCCPIERARAWTNDEINTVLVMRRDGKTHGEIALALDRTMTSVASKCRRLGV